jgi:proteic killer suppression protein
MRPDLSNRVQGLLDALDKAADLTDLNGFGTHPLKATNPLRYSMRVNGPWRITFEFRKGDAYLVDLEQYH